MFGLGKIRFCLSLVSAFLIGSTSIVICCAMFRVKPDRLGVICDGFVEFALIELGDSKIEIRIGILGPKPDHLGVIRDGFVELAVL